MWLAHATPHPASTELTAAGRERVGSPARGPRDGVPVARAEFGRADRPSRFDAAVSTPPFRRRPPGRNPAMTTTESPTHRLPLSEDAQDLLFRSARTANTFTAQEVGDDQLRAVYGLLRWAPTCFNAQPLRIVAVRGEPARDRLIRHLYGANQDKTRSAPLTLLLAADREFDVHLPRLAPFLSQPN